MEVGTWAGASLILSLSAGAEGEGHRAADDPNVPHRPGEDGGGGELGLRAVPGARGPAHPEVHPIPQLCDPDESPPSASRRLRPDETGGPQLRDPTETYPPTPPPAALNVAPPPGDNSSGPSWPRPRGPRPWNGFAICFDKTPAPRP